ncbi:MAG: hypothetical protein PVJ57_04865 [Phycisphaerae bacterium]
MLVAASVGWTRLPGVDGVRGELWWQLHRDKLGPSDWTQIGRLVHLTEFEVPGSRAPILKDLLSSGDFVVVDRTLQILSDLLVLRGADSPNLLALVDGWLQSASADDKLAHRRVLCECGMRRAALNGWKHDAQVPAVEDLRWILVATMDPYSMHTMLARDLLPLEADAVRTLSPRQLFLDGVMPAPAGLGIIMPGLPPAVPLGEPLTESLIALLADPVPEVRWAAGRLLAVAGDARGVPAVIEWLQHEPGRTAVAEKLFSYLYGPEWRDLP